MSHHIICIVRRRSKTMKCQLVLDMKLTWSPGVPLFSFPSIWITMYWHMPTKPSPKVKDKKMKIAADKYGVWLSITNSKQKERTFKNRSVIPALNSGGQAYLLNIDFLQTDSCSSTTSRSKCHRSCIPVRTFLFQRVHWSCPLQLQLAANLLVVLVPVSVVLQLSELGMLPL